MTGLILLLSRPICALFGADAEPFTKKGLIHKIFQKPLHFAGVFGIMIRRLRMPCIFAGRRYAMTREVAARLRRFFPPSMSDHEPGERILNAKGYVCAPCGQTNVHVTLLQVFPGELRGGSPDFLMQGRETPGAVFSIDRMVRPNEFL